MSTLIRIVLIAAVAFAVFAVLALLLKLIVALAFGAAVVFAGIFLFHFGRAFARRLGIRSEPRMLSGGG